jgi:hypothetical protein
MSQIGWTFVYFAVLALWIGGAIGAIVHLVKRERAPVWAVVLIAVVMFLLPIVTVVGYWLVVVVVRLSGGRGPADTYPVSAGGASAWPPPPPPEARH